MISEKCYTAQWLNSFKQQKEHKKIQVNILEKMIYALHLLEMLQASGLKFVFKGGTSLILLLDGEHRFSIDVDIICNTNRKELEEILNRIVENSRFNSVSLDGDRSYKQGVPKAHYIFTFNSVFTTKNPPSILLDVLIDNPIYPQITNSRIKAKWIETDTKLVVKTPTIDAITGDKLTAFAPGTIGIPYFKGDVSFAMEICKQLFDLGRLFDKISDVEMVQRSFMAHALQEIQFRNSKGEALSLTPNMVLHDTIRTCIALVKRDMNKDEPEKTNFRLLQEGIKAFGTGFLIKGNFRIDEATVAASKVAYLAAKLLQNDIVPIDHFKGQDITPLNIEEPSWNFLNRLKKQPDKSAFYYWYQTVQLLKTNPL